MPPNTAKCCSAAVELHDMCLPHSASCRCRMHLAGGSKQTDTLALRHQLLTSLPASSSAWSGTPPAVAAGAGGRSSLSCS